MEWVNQTIQNCIGNCALFKTEKPFNIFNAFFISNTRLKLAKNQVKAKQHPEAELLLYENYTARKMKFS